MSSATDTEQSELRRFRLLMALAATLYPAWHFLYHSILTDPYDPLWQRLLVVAMFVAAGLATWLTKPSRKRLDQGLFLLVTQMTAHFVFLTSQNRFCFEYVVGLIVVLESANLVLTEPRAFVAFQGLTLTMTGFALLFAHDTALGIKLVLFCGILTLAVVSFVAQIQRSMFIKRAHDAALTMVEQQNKMAAVGDATAGLAHEIRNVITIALNYCTVIIRGLATPAPDIAKITAGAEKLHHSLERILTIVRSLQGFVHRADRDEQTTTALRPLVAESIEVVSTKAKRCGAQLSNDVSPTLNLRCQSGQICQVLVNLLSNAIDAVSTLEQRWVRVNAEQVGDAVVLRIVDSGLGVPPELRAKIMEPYFTTKPKGVGTGLGLSISRSLIEQHGGTLTLDESSANTCFTIRLKAEPVAKLGAAS